MTKTLFVAVIILVFAQFMHANPLPSTAAFSIECISSIDDVTKPVPLFTVGDVSIALKPIPKQMVKNPPRTVLSAGDNIRSKVFVYPGKPFHIALVAKDGSAQFYLNGYPDGDPFPLAKAAAWAPADSAIGKSATETDQALSADEIIAHVKALTPHLPVTVCGHRGDNTGCPENTNISYVTALEMKAPVVEMDLRLTKDNVLILLHDATVDRTTTSKGKIADKTLEEANKIDAGSKKSEKFKGEPLPAFQTIIDTCRGKSIMMLDLKLEDLAQPLADIKAKNNLPDDAWVLAPWTDEHGIKLHKVIPTVPMIRLTAKIPDEKFDDAYFAHMKELGFSGFSIAYPINTKAFVDAAHKNGMKIWSWTVNDPADIAGSILVGADGVITDNIPNTTRIVGELTSH